MRKIVMPGETLIEGRDFIEEGNKITFLTRPKNPAGLTRPRAMDSEDKEWYGFGFTKGIEAAIAIIKKTSIQGLGNRRRILAALNSLKQTNTK